MTSMFDEFLRRFGWMCFLGSKSVTFSACLHVHAFALKAQQCRRVSTSETRTQLTLLVVWLKRVAFRIVKFPSCIVSVAFAITADRK